MIGPWTAGSLGLAILLATAARAEEPPTPPMDPRVARCVLQNVALARSSASAELIAEACRALIAQAATDPADGSFALVKCFVPGDPIWIEFRLLTPAQCERAAGISGR